MVAEMTACLELVTNIPLINNKYSCKLNVIVICRFVTWLSHTPPFVTLYAQLTLSAKLE